MQDDSDNAQVREAVGIFANVTDLEVAIDELQSSGFERAELSLMASEHAVEEKLGHKYRKTSELEDDPSVPRTHYVSAESVGAAEGALIGAPLYIAGLAAFGAILASGGTLLAALVAGVVAGGTGGLLGAVLASKVGEHHAQAYEEALAHGGLLLWVRTWTADDEARAIAILKAHSGRDVHVHGQ